VPSQPARPPRAATPVRAVFVDVGETLLDRSREYAAWATLLGVRPHTFSAVFGAVVSRGGDVSDVVRHFRPDGDRAGVRAQLIASGAAPTLAESDLYPGARAALSQLRSGGLYVGIAGNQPADIGAQLRDLGLPVDALLVSDELRVAKPDPAFFHLLAERAGCLISELVYVGDQLDNDVRAALDAGARSIRVRTGPWGQLTADPMLEQRCLAVLDSIADLPATLSC
jgi:FMN phosphatase YigB (HAD superfamily)